VSRSAMSEALLTFPAAQLSEQTDVRPVDVEYFPTPHETQLEAPVAV